MGGQIADIAGPNNVAMLEVDGPSEGLVFSVPYFEVQPSGTAYGGNSVVLFNGVHDVSVNNFMMQPGAGPVSGVDSCFKVMGADTRMVSLHGIVKSAPCANAVKNVAAVNSYVSRYPTSFAGVAYQYVKDNAPVLHGPAPINVSGQ